MLCKQTVNVRVLLTKSWVCVYMLFGCTCISSPEHRCVVAILSECKNSWEMEPEPYDVKTQQNPTKELTPRAEDLCGCSLGPGAGCSGCQA